MKKIEAIIRPSKVPEVIAALGKVGHPGLMVTEIEGHGAQCGVETQVRGKTYKVSLLTKARLEIVVKDSKVKELIRAIRDAAFTGKVGDGKIFVYPVDNAVRIRTDEQGEEAV
jgi:nitrogen regulatory protein P-II 1